MTELAGPIDTRRLPGRLQGLVARLEAGQRVGGAVSAAIPLLRRVEVDDVTYLPEVGRGRTPLRVLVMFLVPISFVAVVFAVIAWIAGEGEWFLALSVSVVAGLGAAVVLALAEAALDRRRRRGVERFGLVLTPDVLLLWGPRRCRVVPRSAFVRVLAERRGGRSGGFRECIDVRTKDGPQRWVLHPRESPGLRQALGRWQRDARPWVRDEVERPAGSPPRPGQ